MPPVFCVKRYVVFRGRDGNNRPAATRAVISTVAKSVELCYTEDVLAAEKARLCGGSLFHGGRSFVFAPDHRKGVRS